MHEVPWNKNNKKYVYFSCADKLVWLIAFTNSYFECTRKETTSSLGIQGLRTNQSNIYLFISLCSKPKTNVVYQPPSLYGGEDDDVSLSAFELNYLKDCSRRLLWLKYMLAFFVSQKDAIVFIMFLFFIGGFQAEVIICGIVCNNTSCQYSTLLFSVDILFASQLKFLCTVTVWLDLNLPLHLSAGKVVCTLNEVTYKRSIKTPFV